LADEIAMISALCARAISSKAIFAPNQVTDRNIEHDEDR
jgi:hypothetical protein